jgi:hypothetical protein
MSSEQALTDIVGGTHESESNCTDSAAASVTFFSLTHRPQSTQPAAARLNRAIEG